MGSVFEIRPVGFHPSIDVVACFIQVGWEVLFLRRHPNKSHGHTWAIPGGKVEKGDQGNLTQAIKREVLEETGIEITPIFLKTVYITDINGFSFNYHMFFTIMDSKPAIILNPNEAVDYAWWDKSKTEAEQEFLIPDEWECINLAVKSKTTFIF